MRFFGREVEGYAKVLVILTAVLLVASGLCGAQWAILDNRRNGVDNLAALFALTGIVELGAMLLSLVGIVVVLILWAISHLFVQYPMGGEHPIQPISRVTSQIEGTEGPSSEDADAGDR